MPEFTASVRTAARPAAASAPVAAVFERVATATSSHGVDAERERARSAGYAAGFAAGAAEAARAAQVDAEHTAARRASDDARRATEHAAAVDALERAAQAAAARTAPVLAQAEARLHAAALELAAAVLGTEVADGERSARAALARVLAHPLVPGVHTVRLSPRDLAALQSGGIVRPSGVELVADPALAPGDAVGEHPDGYLDGRIDAALARARAVLLTEAGTVAGPAAEHASVPSGAGHVLPHQRGYLA